MINSDFLRRLRALTIKEWCQLIRDPSSFAVGLVLPLVLVFIFGSGLSLDLGNTPIAVINQAPGQVSYAIEQGFKGSPYLTPIRCGNIKEAESLMRKKEVKGIVVIPSNFAGQFQAGKGKLQLVVHGVDTVSASSLERYIQQSVQLSLGKLGYSSEKGAVPVVRLWFNAANSSTWYFVPGLVVIVITIVGAFLTALVIAREWERGTMEMLFSTPVKPAEILLSKVIPYFIVGIGGLFLCLFAARFIFEVPIEGSLTVIIGSSCIYLLTALGAGLWISGITKNQFLASQLVIIISFLPSVMLSGFVFDLRNVPSAISAVSYVLPPTYFMELIRASFLSGTDAVTVLKDVSILAGYAFLFFFFVTRTLKKTLEKK